MGFKMQPETPLDQLKKDFETFKVSEPVTIKSESVWIHQEVKYPSECKEQAKETFTIENELRTICTGKYCYTMLRDVVPGPRTDGNREQIIDDCKIQTIVDMRDAKTMKQQASFVSGSQPVKAPIVPESGNGCGRSTGSTPVLLFAIMAALIMRKVKLYG